MGKHLLKISVVIPTYRRPDLLQRCLSALKAQHFPGQDYEVLVVSDGPDTSIQKTVETYSDISSSFHYLSLPQKKGPAAARNFGYQQAKGLLIAFTDDDTVPGANWLAALWQAYKGEKEIAFTGKIKVPVSRRPTDYERNTAGLESAAFVTANCCCTKAALERTGGFDERFSMAWREDSDLEFKLLLHNIPIVPVPEALVIHPVRKAPWGISLQEQKKGMFNALLYKKYPGLYRRKIQADPPWNYYVMVASLMLVLIGILSKAPGLSFVSFTLWFFLFIRFLKKRLAPTSKKMGHVLEMIVTSLFIPFLSVYWQLYGAWRYKVLFL